MEANQFVIMS
jgi:hypothetical protein